MCSAAWARITAVLALLLLAGCSSKKPTVLLTRSGLREKKIAIAEIEGGREARNHVEVALINEIIERGRFQVIDRATVQEAQVSYPDRSDWKRLGDKLLADFILCVKILDFSVRDREGLDLVEQEDSLLAEEAKSADPILAKRYVKVRSSTGLVRLKLSFFDVARDKMLQEGIGEATETVHSREGPGGDRKMAFLESLAARAVMNFFNSLPQN